MGLCSTANNATVDIQKLKVFIRSELELRTEEGIKFTFIMQDELECGRLNRNLCPSRSLVNQVEIISKILINFN